MIIICVPELSKGLSTAHSVKAIPNPAKWIENSQLLLAPCPGRHPTTGVGSPASGQQNPQAWRSCCPCAWVEQKTSANSLWGTKQGCFCGPSPAPLPENILSEEVSWSQRHRNLLSIRLLSSPVKTQGEIKLCRATKSPMDHIVKKSAWFPVAVLKLAPSGRKVIYC